MRSTWPTIIVANPSDPDSPGHPTHFQPWTEWYILTIEGYIAIDTSVYSYIATQYWLNHCYMAHYSFVAS